MTRLHTFLALLTILVLPSAAHAADPSKPAESVASLLESHDRALVRDLNSYIENHRDAEDLDQAYLSLFERAIEHDWFLDSEDAAKTLSSRETGRRRCVPWPRSSPRWPGPRRDSSRMP